MANLENPSFAVILRWLCPAWSQETVRRTRAGADLPRWPVVVEIKTPMKVSS
jgi:hypothetical protein